MDQLTEAQVEALRELYESFDFSGTGRLDQAAVGAVLRTIGVPLSQAELNDLMGRLSLTSSAGGGEPSIDLQEFIHLMCSSLDDADPAEEIDRAYAFFDQDHDTRVSTADVVAAAKELGVHLDEASAREMLAEVAADVGTGASRAEFAAIQS
jgi:Ca2+-binding EF-hand superfamily protein